MSALVAIQRDPQIGRFYDLLMEYLRCVRRLRARLRLQNQAAPASANQAATVASF